MPEFDTDPDLEEILQAEIAPVHEGPPLPVMVEGPVRTQPMPSVADGMRRITFRDGTAQPVKIVPANPKRSTTTLQIITVGGIIHMGLTAAQSISDQAPQWAGAVPLVLHSRNELWACAPNATVGAPIVVTVVVEDWAR